MSSTPIDAYFSESISYSRMRMLTCLLPILRKEQQYVNFYQIINIQIYNNKTSVIYATFDFTKTTL